MREPLELVEYDTSIGDAGAKAQAVGADEIHAAIRAIVRERD
jgi:hypothetical protein